MDKIYKLLLLILLFSRLGISQNEIPHQYEEFDPLTLNEPFLPIANGTMIKEIFTGIEPDRYSQRDSMRYVEQMGWKVQAVSIKDGVEADSILNKLSSVFGKENTQMIWNPPYWKIRVGNCASRMEAERLLDRIKRMGYNRAWIIRARVRIREKQIPF
ncbi:MAG: SPOR domain-containing protein [Candidatus Marinimicrobia bacterium]|nr:SPOR domain-containing protein [Candidatus Neomarinimicrobiota bacterium]